MEKMTWQERLFCAVTGKRPDSVNFPASLAENTERVLETLGEWERKAIHFRFASGLSHEEIGARYHVPAERVRYFDLKAMKELREPSRRSVLAYSGIYPTEQINAVAV
ncbi:MAG: sigma factor-like helix-turn-helix DNA-binding protein [Candidatus Saccharibacteria bacterium]|nr:sigma factor-like helix-turn-helix DNA-binding protein [Candidatus Saccharibacteria bacterium]